MSKTKYRLKFGYIIQVNTALAMKVLSRITVWPFRDGVQWTDPSKEAVLTHSITLSQTHPHKPHRTCFLTHFTDMTI